MNRPQLGQRVRVRALARKTHTPRMSDGLLARCQEQHPGFDEDYLKRQFGTWWTTFEREEAEPFEGIYIGWRTVFEGHKEWDGGDEYDGAEVFVARGHKEVWLIGFDPRRVPVMAFPEDVEILEEA